mgnify:CR=1 FL=1
MRLRSALSTIACCAFALAGCSGSNDGTRVLVVGWDGATTTQVYTVHDLHPFLADEIVRRGAAKPGLTWYYARPPVEGLEYEMDLRGVPVERVL